MNQNSAHTITVIGGGLAGSEAAWQIASRGGKVRLIEMRPVQMTKAHKTDNLAELVCSNSFRGAALNNAVGLLKEELRACNSLIMRAADASAVPAGGALAVDRLVFGAYVTDTLQQHENIEVVREEVSSIPDSSTDAPVIIATGPLTSPTLARDIERFTGSGSLSFFDAISPVIEKHSIDFTKVFRQSRYDKNGDDYLNLPLSKDAYYQFIEAVAAAEKFGGHEEVEADAIENLRPFEGCMPIEEMIARGPETLRFGPLKPMGLTDPTTGKRPYAVVQLRQDDRAGNLWSMVGFQTRMKHPEQQRIFRSLPGLENAEFARLGSVHRNSFINSPEVLQSTLQTRQTPSLFFAGQITGVEGYVESTAAGLVAGINAWRLASGEVPVTFPISTAIGALIDYVSDPSRKNFQPMNISFGLIAKYHRDMEEKKKKRISKKDIRTEMAQGSLVELQNWIEAHTS